MIYYNEFDPKAAEWLHWLMGIGVIPQGDIDERSIKDVRPADLKGYTQCHFFAGIGGWPLALAISGIPPARKLWTGSCPCQPFSAAGQRKGIEDPRHLWPVFERLIAECNPSTVFGEQVASSDGRKWLAGVRFDLEALGYAVGAADYCAAGVGAPNIRQRLWWVAYSHMSERDGWTRSRQQPVHHESEAISGLGDAAGIGRKQRRAGADRSALGQCGFGWLGDTDIEGLQGRGFDTGEYADQWTPWEASAIIPCSDGKARRIESGSFPLADGVSGRVGLLRGYGNAINPFAAARFIEAAEHGRKSL